eukprot:gene19024-biopygen6954
MHPAGGLPPPPRYLRRSSPPWITGDPWTAVTAGPPDIVRDPPGFLSQNPTSKSSAHLISASRTKNCLNAIPRHSLVSWTSLSASASFARPGRACAGIRVAKQKKNKSSVELLLNPGTETEEHRPNQFVRGGLTLLPPTGRWDLRKRCAKTVVQKIERCRAHPPHPRAGWGLRGARRGIFRPKPAPEVPEIPTPPPPAPCARAGQGAACPRQGTGTPPAASGVPSHLSRCGPGGGRYDVVRTLRPPPEGVIFFLELHRYRLRAYWGRRRRGGVPAPVCRTRHIWMSALAPSSDAPPTWSRKTMTPSTVLACIDRQRAECLDETMTRGGGTNAYSSFLRSTPGYSGYLRITTRYCTPGHSGLLRVALDYSGTGGPCGPCNPCGPCGPCCGPGGPDSPGDPGGPDGTE